MSDLPIEDHAFLSDCHSAALVTRDGSVDWLTFPRFDAPSVFARLLDDRGGHLAVRPVGTREVARRHLDRSLVLETTFSTGTGTFQLTDALSLRVGDRGHQLGDGAAEATVTLHAGDQVAFALQWSRAWEQTARWSPEEVRRRLDDTLEAWQTWSDNHQRYDGPWADLVSFSGVVLQALTFQPTGAIVAAPTTSLPEAVGGTRNWDYRYAWLRDASRTLDPGHLGGA